MPSPINYSARCLEPTGDGRMRFTYGVPCPCCQCTGVVPSDGPPSRFNDETCLACDGSAQYTVERTVPCTEGSDFDLALVRELHNYIGGEARNVARALYREKRLHLLRVDEVPGTLCAVVEWWQAPGFSHLRLQLDVMGEAMRRHTEEAMHRRAGRAV